MPAIEEGRNCVVTMGLDAGKKCKITKVLDENRVLVQVEGSKKERKCSIRHLEPLA